MLKTLRQIWRRITSTRYTRALESELAQQRAENVRQRDETNSLRAEIARVRAENRALLNSILGIAGIPPIPLPPDFSASRSSIPILAVPYPAKCHSESAAADDESRSTPSLPSLTAAEKNSTGSQSPRNDIPPNPSPESSSLRFSAPSSAQASPASTPRRPLAAPLRRRSWHQIMRTLELASGKTPSATD